MRLILIFFLVVMYILIKFDIPIIGINLNEDYENFVREYNNMLSIEDPYELESWVTKNPESPHQLLAKHILEEMYWYDAFEQNSIYAYNKFLKAYPNSNKKSIALKFRAVAMNDLEEYERLLKIAPDDHSLIWHRDYLVIHNAMVKNNKRAFEDFIDKYPDSEFISMAKYFVRNVYK